VTAEQFRIIFKTDKVVWFSHHDFPTYQAIAHQFGMLMKYQIGLR
jgi:hypothetical protein